MAIHIDCECGERIAIPEGNASTSLRCPACGKRLDPSDPDGRDPSSSPRARTIPELDEETRISLAVTVPGGVPVDGPPPIATPRTLGRYEVTASLGQGGMGEVLLVRDPELNRELAAKVVRGGGQDRRRLQKFLVEAQVTGQLEHPNIVPVHELARTSDGHLYFTMKRVLGRDLQAILAEGRRDPGRGDPTSGSKRRRSPEAQPSRSPGESIARLLDVFLRICDAVAFAHSRRVIHRDLKPSNVMVGAFGEVQLMDWGLAKIRGRADLAADAVTIDLGAHDRAVGGTTLDESGLPLATLDGSVFGTPAYMPPEQAAGRVDEIDERSDIYSLGAILYEVLAHAPPYSGKSARAVLAKVLEGRLVPPSRRAPRERVPRELEAVVLKAMSRSPGDRYQRVGEIKAEIESFLSGRALAAADYSPWELLGKWVRRHKAVSIGAVAAGIGLLAASIAVVLALSVGRRTGEERERAERADQALASWDEGRTQWSRADEVAPYNPALPQAFFRSHIAALARMGRGVANHPDPPPEWRESIKRLASDLQEKAQAKGDWPLAQVLAELPREWKAADDMDTGERLVRVDEAIQLAVEEDRTRLQTALDRIADAERRTSRLQEHPEGDHGALLPGEVEERARRLARKSRVGVMDEVIRRLVNRDPPPGSAGRRFLIEILGRSGDVETSADGFTGPSLVHQQLSQDEKVLAGLGADEIAALVQAGTRLAGVAPQLWKSLDPLLTRVKEAFTADVPIARGVERALTLVRLVTDPGVEFSDPRAEAEAFHLELEELGDWLASSARSGTDYTRSLLEFATEEPRLTTGQVALVFGQIGRMGDDAPPDPGRPRPSDVLRAAFDAIPRQSLRDSGPSAPSSKSYDRARETAIHAAMALSRLEDASFAMALLESRGASGDHSRYFNRTALAFTLLPEPGDVEPHTAQEYLLRGLGRQFRGDFAGALVDLSRAIELTPNSPTLYGNRAQVRAKLHDVPGALADLARAMQLAPNSGNAYAARAGIRFDGGDLQGAIADFSRAIELQPEVALHHANRALVQQRVNDLDGALADSDRAVAIAPSLAFGHAVRALVLVARGDFEQAMHGANCALELDPSNSTAYAARGKARGSLGDRVGALDDLSRAVQLSPDSAEIRYARGEVLIDQGDGAGAIRDLTRAIELRPDFAEAYVARGLALRAMGDSDSAIADFSRAIEIHPDDPLTYRNRGVVRVERRELAEGVADFSMAIELDPDDAKAYCGRGLARQALQDHAGAVGDFSRAIELQADFADAYSSRALSRNSLRDSAGAEEDCSRVIEIQPNYPGVHCIRGFARWAQGDSSGALEDLDKSISLDPADWKGWAGRGTALVGLARIEDATLAFAKAAELCPPSEHAALESLRSAALGD